jgi:hypothetical protein
MRVVLAATLTLLVSNAAAAQEYQTCSMADARMKAYLKATSEAKSATKQAIRNWNQNLDRKASAELSSRGTRALQDTLEMQVRSELGPVENQDSTCGLVVIQALDGTVRTDGRAMGEDGAALSG